MARMSISSSIGIDHKTEKGTGSVDGPWKKEHGTTGIARTAPQRPGRCVCVKIASARWNHVDIASLVEYPRSKQIRWDLCRKEPEGKLLAQVRGHRFPSVSHELSLKRDVD